jgi:hypothetical protein
MQAGDIVRFRFRSHPLCTTGPWMLGLLIEYYKWEKIATVMYEETVYRIRAEDVQLHARGEHAKHR